MPRAQLLREVDKNTTSSILRREELYFTRTNMLKEQIRLRGELERRGAGAQRVRHLAEVDGAAAVLVQEVEEAADVALVLPFPADHLGKLLEAYFAVVVDVQLEERPQMRQSLPPLLRRSLPLRMPPSLPRTLPLALLRFPALL